MQDVVGINTEHKGLSVRLLRSASLLGMLHLYRFGYVVGILQVSILDILSTDVPKGVHETLQCLHVLALVMESAPLPGMLSAFYQAIQPCVVVQAQHERDSLSSAEQERRKLQAQRGICALATRFFILHASKIVTFMLFWAAMQQPGGFGWILTGVLQARTQVLPRICSDRTVSDAWRSNTPNSHHSRFCLDKKKMQLALVKSRHAAS